MKRMLAGILWMVVTLAARGAEVGWKIPFSYYAGMPLAESGAVRMEKAAGESPFFAAGVELWDLKNVKPQWTPPALEWIVWDATSRRLVAKGEWAEIYRMHHLLRAYDQPVLCRLAVDAFETPEDGRPLADDAVPVASVGFLVRSGLKNRAKWSGCGNSLDVEIEGNFGGASSLADLRFLCSIDFAGQPRMEVNTNVSLESGKPLWIARDSDGTRGIDLRATAVLQLLDGSLASEQMMVREDGKLVSMWPPSQGFGPIQTASGWIAAASLSPDDFFGIDRGKVVDPFANPPMSPTESWQIGDFVKPPVSLAPWVQHDLLDAAKTMIQNFPNIPIDVDFAGFDPTSALMYLSADKKEAVELVTQLLAPGCNLPLPAILMVTLDGAGQHRLLGKSGQKSTLVRLNGKDTELRSFEIEPSFGDNGQLIDVRSLYEEYADSKLAVRLDTSVTLIAGRAIEVYSGSGNGTETKLRMTADVVQSFGR